MLRYTARRRASAVLVVFGVTLATFLLMHVEPGDPARSVLGIHATPSAVAALRRQWGLNSSLPVQFGRFLSQLVQGNLGQSYIYHVSVASLIGEPDRPDGRPGGRGCSSLPSSSRVPLAALAASRKDGVRRPRRPWRCPSSGWRCPPFGSASCSSRSSRSTCTSCRSAGPAAVSAGTSRLSCSRP